MRAIRLEQPRKLQAVEVANPPRPSAGQALVRTHRMGICGTDYAGYLGKMPFFSYPRIPGHELGVEVLQVGPDVVGIQVGDRCSVEPYMNCGTCFACRSGHGNCCQHLQVIGVMCDGGLCETILIRADKLHPSSQLAYEQLALVETLAIGCHANDRCAAQAGDQALIIGAGPIGLATLEFMRLTGARITVMDRIPSRLDFCRRTYSVPHTLLATGAEDDMEQMLDITGGDRFAVVIDATGNSRSMADALQYVAPTGTLVYVGITSDSIAFPHPWLHKPELTIKGSRNARPQDFERIIALIEQGTIDTDAWITHRTTFDRLVDDFEMFLKPETGVIKAMIEL